MYVQIIDAVTVCSIACATVSVVKSCEYESRIVEWGCISVG